jgi:hypothetical protein
LPVRTSVGTARYSQSAVSPPHSSQQQRSATAHRTPKNYTPKKVDWTTDKIEQSLRKFALDIGTDAAKVSSRLTRIGWKRMAPEPKSITKKNWFTDMKHNPADGSKEGTMKIKTKVGEPP